MGMISSFDNLLSHIKVCRECQIKWDSCEQTMADITDHLLQSDNKGEK